MEASKFWKLRNVWHGIKRRFGLSEGPIADFDVPPMSAIAASVGGDYGEWVTRHTPRPSDLARLRLASKSLARRPFISVVVATYNTPERYLRSAIDSVVFGVYDRWELCIADDASTEPHVRLVLDEYARRDPRIKVTFRGKNGHISAATQSALERAEGEYVVFLDHDDLLAPDALYEIALALNVDATLDVIYSDEDKIDDSGRLSDPHFKPDWSPESFLSRMYVGHLTSYRRSLIEAVGGFRSGFDGSQDYDLLLRVSERTQRIHHIPRVLYHWRVHHGSTAATASAKPYAADAAERALNEALRRRGEEGRIRALADCPGTYEVRFAIRAIERVSIIVPTREHGSDVRRCVESAFEKTRYPKIDLTILDNGSVEAESRATFASLAANDSRVRVIRYDVPFNFSEINNYAVARTDGTYLLFLNNDTEACSDDWIEAMVEHAQRKPIGAVGALLLYPDESVQHAGVITGLGGVAGHSHKNYPATAPGYYYMLKALTNYSAVTAACMMVRREVFEQVGGFDESLAVAFNDVDFCLRVREAGYRNLYVPHVVLRHFESKSRGLDTSPEKVERFAREIRYMKRKWPLLGEPDPYYSPNLTLDREDFSLAP